MAADYMPTRQPGLQLPGLLVPSAGPSEGLLFHLATKPHWTSDID